MPLWLTVCLALAPSVLTFGVGIIIGYGKATARMAVVEQQAHTQEMQYVALSLQVTRLENILLYGNPEGGRRKTDRS